MTKLDVSNWIALYAATGVCCAFAMVLSVSTVAYALCRERVWRTVTDWRSTAILTPKIWWRWHKRYLLSTPVTLAIIAAFATTLDWAGSRFQSWSELPNDNDTACVTSIGKIVSGTVAASLKEASTLRT